MGVPRVSLLRLRKERNKGGRRIRKKHLPGYLRIGSALGTIRE